MIFLKKDKQVLFFGLIVLVSFFKTQAMTVARPKNIDLSSEQRRQAIALKLKKEVNTTPSKIWHGEDDLVDASLCTNEFFVHGSDNASRGICAPRDVVMTSQDLKEMIDIYPVEDKKQPYDTSKPIIITINFPIATVKDTFDLLKVYIAHQDESPEKLTALMQEKIGNYSVNQLIGVFNCIHNYKFPQTLQNILLEKIKNVKQGIGFLVAKKQLNPDVAKSLIIEPAIDCLTNLLQKNNLYKNPKILRDYSQGNLWTNSIACDRNGENTIEGLSNKCILRDPDGKIKISHTFGFNVYKVAMSPDGSWVAIGGSGGNLQLYNCSSKSLYGYPGVAGDVRSIEFSFDSTKMVAASWGGSFNLYDVTTGVVGWGYNQNKPITCVAFNSDATLVVIGHVFADNTDAITIRNSANGAFIKSFKSYGSLSNWASSNIFSMSFSPDDKKILYIEKIKQRLTSRVVLLDVDSKKTTLFEANCMKPRFLSADYMIGEYATNIISAAFTADGKNIIMCDKKNIILCRIDSNYNIIQEDVIPIAKDMKNPIYNMVMSANNQKILLRYGIDDPDITLPADKNKLAFAKFTFWTDEDEQIIHQLKKSSYNQTKLIRELCSGVQKNGYAKKLSPGTVDYNNFEGTSTLMKKVLSPIFWPKITGWIDWFFGWME